MYMVRVLTGIYCQGRRQIIQQNSSSLTIPRHILICEPTQRHIVKNVPLKVTPSFKCRFGEVWDYKKHEVKLPEDITVTWMDTPILTFFISDKSLSRIKDINTHLHAHSAEVCCLDGEKLCIKCLLTQTTPGVRKIAKSWTTDVRKTYDDIVKKTLLKIKISCSSPKIYAELKENLPKINLSKDVNVLEDDKVHCFIIVGPNTAAQNSQKKILEMKKTIESENNIVSESKTFTSGKIYILEKEGVIGQVNKIADDLDVFTDQEAGVIYFKGTANDVLEAKVKIYEALNKKTVRRVYGLSPLQIKLMKNVVGLIHETFQCYNIKGAVDYSSEKIEVITSTENENILAVDLVKNFVIERVINLGFESLSVLDKQQWSFTVNKMKRDHAEKILIEIFDSIITVAATCDIFDEVFEELKSVIDHNTIISESIELNSNGEFEFLEKFRFDDLEKLQNDLSGECVQIEMHSDSLSIEISGTKSGIDKAKSSLNQEIQDIIKIKYVKKGVGISKADVLVCTVSHDLNLATGRASSGLLKAGGDSLQCECRTKFPNGIKDGEIVSVKGGNLSCKEVYFGALPRWNAEYY
ncbi:hypothetical protein KUTeg_005235 [Tegillarca granosa]|uniref:PARP14 first type I KH domain-containing protein n=1 Tax=Tegillarca granosa TaxID=220873 RepID=A0ABQ9FJ63_TEGGR|nr:hypothetical protein KUTeg_005235 [Tegillarca granosa]